ncbi:LAFE_0E11936g1_1 [Lachancea fermentati]|uniref:peptide chain release factor N(5)-glutamine methyltransferase n=1 Tax=Lachancea fermentati TaxID=4955 RepID=A0A1G4MDP8_LACFM|nr:LAFE_0E11936g1_1 [Lachancea fermentati]
MPRIGPRIMSEAQKIHRYLPLLLPECRSIAASLQELKWIKNELNSPRKIHQACRLRGLHYPLQYILGSQPFGELDVICKSGVLIPRWETAEWAQDLADRLPAETKMTVTDLCTGTGCIPLLLKYNRPQIDVTGIDISSKALSLSRQNSKALKLELHLQKQDVLNNNEKIGSGIIDILTCNPPYIPRRDFIKETTLSVKLYEPRLALLGDMEFYKNLVEKWLYRSNSFIYEVGDISQSEYVLKEIQHHTVFSSLWHVGFRNDSNGHPRVVYGFRKEGTSHNMSTIFQNYGQLMH